MAFLTRDQILERRSFRTETVDVPEWGGAVRIRELSGADRQAMEVLARREEKTPGASGTDLLAHVVACGAVDEAGQPLFGQADAKALSLQPSAVLKRLSQRILEISGLSGDLPPAGAASDFSPPPNGASPSA